LRARGLIRDGIEETSGWIGTGGVFNMNFTDHVGLDKDRSLDMLEVRGGKIVPVQMRK
jgi:branched-chain amino acid transport system substrate-binding protein